MPRYKLHDVFLSYRRYEDKERTDDQGTRIADAIYGYLTSKGLKVFLDRPEMETGSFDDQLRWQLEHSPNYIFIATENARHFRNVTPPEVDYVAEEVRFTVEKMHEQERLPNRSRDRVTLPVVPPTRKKSEQPYPEEVRELLGTQQAVELSGDLPTEEELKRILRYVTAVNRGNMWNAGRRWLEQATQPGSRFAELNIDRTILPFAGEEEKEDGILPILARAGKEQDAPLMDVIARTPGHLYLTGEGGIGKTTALFSVMKQVYGPGRDENDVERDRMNGQVPLFIELSKAPDTYGRLYEGGVSSFIARAVYQQIRQDLKAKQVPCAAAEEVQEVFNLDPETAVRPVHDLFTQETPAPEYLLLLDGLNEVSRTEIGYTVRDGDGTERKGKASVVSMVLREIRDLMTGCPNVRVILTSRSREQTSLSEKTTLLYLSGVKDDTIETYLRGRNVAEARIEAALRNAKLKEILRIPLFLTMYATLDGDEEILTRGEILHLFFHQKKKKLYTIAERNEEIDADVERTASEMQPARLTAGMKSFLLDFILPEIAWRMVREGEFYLYRKGRPEEEGLREIIRRVLTDRSETSVCGENGSDAFSSYRMGDDNSSTGDTAAAIRECLQGDVKDEDNAKEKIVSGVLACSAMTLGILQRNGSSGLEEYGFIHQHIRDYFAAVHQINRLRLAVFLHRFDEKDQARSCLADWKAHPLPPEVRRFIGEALGEAHNAPVCDERGDRHYVVPEEDCDRNLIRRGFDLYRGRFDGQDGYAVWNLLEILKAVRDDLSGEDFSRLDLTRCVVNGHTLGEKGCAARMNGAKIRDELFMPCGHTGRINTVRYSRNGQRIVTASDDGTAKVWDAETLQEIGTLNVGTRVSSACFNMNGRQIVTASKTAKVWNAETLKEICTLNGHTGWVYYAGYSPDGQWIITGSGDGTVRVWDANVKAPGDIPREIAVLNARSGFVVAADCSKDRKIVAAVWDRITGTKVKVWDAELWEIGTLEGDTDDHFAVFSPDGRRIVISRNHGSGEVWNVDPLREIGKLRGETFARYSPDGRRIVTGSGHRAIIWDADTLQEIGTLCGHSDFVSSVAYSPDGHRIVTSSWDKTVKVWDAATLQEIGTLNGDTRLVNFAGYCPDGRRIVTASGDKAARVWDAGTMRCVGTLNGHDAAVLTANYSPDGQRIVTASRDNTAKIWDAVKMQEIGTLRGHLFGEVHFAAYSPNCRRIVTASEDRTVRIWDAITTREIVTTERQFTPVHSVVYSPDGQRIVTTEHATSTVKVWNAETLQIIRPIYGAFTRYVEYSRDGGRIVMAGLPTAIWDANTLEKIGDLNDHPGSSRFASFSPDGKRIVAAFDDGTAMIWDAETRQKKGTLAKHTGSVRSAVYNPEGNRIVTASWDQTAKVWDAESFECIHTIHNVPGLMILGVDLRGLHPGSSLSDETRERLYEYGAILDALKQARTGLLRDPLARIKEYGRKLRDALRRGSRRPGQTERENSGKKGETA